MVSEHAEKIVGLKFMRNYSNPPLTEVFTFSVAYDTMQVNEACVIKNGSIGNGDDK